MNLNNFLTDNTRYIIGAIIGFLIAFLIFGRSPDVNIQKDKVYISYKSYATTSVSLNTNASITGATSASISPTGSIILTGTSLSINTSSSLSSNTVVDTYSTLLSTHYNKETTYNGSIYVMWNVFDLKYVPYSIGLSYVIVNPIELNLEYLTQRNSLLAGVRLKY